MRSILILTLLLCCTGAIAQTGTRSSAYVDSAYHFTFSAPNLGADTASPASRIAMFFGPTVDDFSSNINIMVQNGNMAQAAYHSETLSQFRDAGLKVTVDSLVTVNGTPGIYWEYGGMMQGRDLRFVALALTRREGTYLITGTCLRDA